jgi:hypothetical protein
MLNIRFSGIFDTAMAFCLTAETDDICGESQLVDESRLATRSTRARLPTHALDARPQRVELGSKLPIAQVVQKGDPSLERAGNLANIGWEVVS